jgi:glycosyltransferase involved in cell wall biosynthesis
VLSEYGSKIRAIRQANRGLSAARNAGINVAQGDFLALLDADDAWWPAKIAAQIAAYKDHPEVGAVGCGAELVDSTGKRIRVLDYAEAYPGQRDGSRSLVPQFRAVAVRDFWVSGSGSGALIRKTTLQDVGLFDESLGAAEDWDMWLRIAARYPIHNVQDVLVTIYQHGSGSFRNAEKMELNQWRVYEAALMRQPGMFNWTTLRRARALILADAAGEYVFGKEYSLALRRYAASLSQWPFHRGRWYRVARVLARGIGL